MDTIQQVSPYLLCLWLSELTLTFEGEWLKEHGVGGVFHFVAQTPSGESAQAPAVYVFSAADRVNKTIRSWLYRVVPVAGGLYVEERIPPSVEGGEGSVSNDTLFDTAARYDLPKYTEEELVGMVKEELDAIGSRFFFCGFGFADPGDRASTGFVATNELRIEDLFAPDGRLTSWVRDQIVKGIEGAANL